MRADAYTRAATRALYFQDVAARISQYTRWPLDVAYEYVNKAQMAGLDMDWVLVETSRTGGPPDLTRFTRPLEHESNEPL